MDEPPRQEIKQGKFVNDNMLQTAQFCNIQALTGFIPKAQSQIQESQGKLLVRSIYT